MSWDDGLRGQAHDIAATEERRLRVVAGPGTGKSFALKRRVARLLEQGQDPTRVLAVTFTRNAAASLVDDLRSLNVPGCDAVNVRTLHSYCFRLLTRDEVFAYLNRHPRPIISVSKARSLQFEGGVMLSDLAFDKRFGNKRARAKRVRAFEAAWARLQSDEPGWPNNPVDEEFEEQLISWLKFHRAMLIGELVPQAVNYLRDNPMSSDLRAFDHVLVDEYQDLNRAEQEIIDLLSKDGAAAIVGDPDQSIYSFRFANPEGIADYLNRHTALSDQSLTECRRCPTRVVGLANALIAKNYKPGAAPRLRSMAGNVTGEVHVIQWKESEDEAEGVSEYIQHLLKNRGYCPADIMVLTPRRKLAYRLRDTIAQCGTDVYSFYPEEALEDEAAQSAFTLLTLLSNPEDRVALRWWLGRGSQDGRHTSYRKLRSHCEATGESPREVLESIESGALRLPGVTALSRQFRALQESMTELNRLDLSELVDRLLPSGDESLSALREVATVCLADSATVRELHELVRSHITQPELPRGDFVRVMSPQKAKGLTSKVVIVTGCIEGLLPVLDDDLAPDEQAALIAEQRRLFYVAITRSTDILVVSSFANIEYGVAKNIGARVQGGNRRRGRTIASRFVRELGPTAPRSRTGSDWRDSGYADPAVGRAVVGGRGAVSQLRRAAGL